MDHEGDGGDEPPHPFDGGFGVHQIDVVPPRRSGMTCFIWEVGSYIRCDIALDKNAWKEVPKAERHILIFKPFQMIPMLELYGRH
ncbi:unnamed protein product [Lactuca virosa]|uniref:Uncharacterized protein n=1 Tax=Lactuca virosa TaxID=75947 RepID=A0AAU9LP60_9ASTR|nr:unnamed protein product [Lactuca virosa]